MTRAKPGKPGPTLSSGNAISPSAVLRFLNEWLGKFRRKISPPRIREMSCFQSSLMVAVAVSCARKSVRSLPQHCALSNHDAKQRRSSGIFAPRQIARRTRHSRHFLEYNLFCTTRVAVIDSLLDRRKSSRSNPLCAKKFFREVFHAAKYFVLVCRLFYLLTFSFVQAPAPQQTGGALH
jgi:hypothetical protein